MQSGRENIELIDKEATTFISKNRSNRSHPGHELPHLRTVAQLTELAGIAADFPPRTVELTRIPGWFHDFERSSNETMRGSDEALSSQALLKFVQSLKQRGLYQCTLDEKEGMVYAIQENSRPPDFFSTKPDPNNWSLSDRLLGALFTADKLDANGVWVIARRSQFVAGARLHDPKEADLPKYGLRPFKDEVKAVLLESAARIAFINPEGLYPEVFRPLTTTMYTPQREFICGLLKAMDMSINDYAQMILDTRLIPTPGHPNYLQARNITAPQNPADLAHILRKVGGLSDWGIQIASEDQAVSAIEAVHYFSGQYQLPLEELVQKWHPRSLHARSWHTSMLMYMNGEWFDQVRQLLLTHTPRGFQP